MRLAFVPYFYRCNNPIIIQQTVLKPEKKYQTVQMMLKQKETCLTKKYHTKCEQCNYTTTQEGHFLMHIKSIHDGVEYKC